MELESFANELLLDLFEYLPTVDLLQAFYDLNTRFANLVVVHFQYHTLNLRSICKGDFDFICQKYLPAIADRVCSLRLSDGDDTPQQLDLFFAHGLSLRRFSRLKSLSIHRFHSSNSIRTVVDQLVDLPSLTRLKITRHHMKFNDDYDIGLIRRIERLPKLTFCHLDIMDDKVRYFPPSSMTSSSITHLSLPYFTCAMNQFIELTRNLPRLSSLLVPVHDVSMLPCASSISFLSITKFHSTFYGSLCRLSNLLQAMPNLQELKIDVESSYIDAHQWQVMIESYLPCLSKLQFKMSLMALHAQAKDDVIDELLDSFRNPFWITAHRWFVQCGSRAGQISQRILVYTLPYAFRDAFVFTHDRLRSTAPEDTSDWSFDSIQHLYHDRAPHTTPFASAIRLNNIRHLDVSIPLNCICPSLSALDRLISLTVYPDDRMNAEDVRSSLQLLLDRAPALRSLTFHSWSKQDEYLLNITHRALRQLYLKGPSVVYSHEQCAQLSRSLIGQQCEVLQIRVSKRTDIVDQVTNMNKLRALTIQCTETRSAHVEGDQRVEWLRQHLPKICAISLSEETDNEIRMWIR